MWFRLDMSGAVDICRDSELKKRLSKLSERFRFSDPVSSPELKAAEDRLGSEINTLVTLIDSDNKAALAKADETELLPADRNRRCKELKHSIQLL